MKITTIIGLLILLPACMPKHLLRDHQIQTAVVAASCKDVGYGNGKCTIDDLEQMATQACLIYAAREFRDGQECLPEEELVEDMGVPE
jgi:hypothetical protein